MVGAMVVKDKVFRAKIKGFVVFVEEIRDVWFRVVMVTYWVMGLGLRDPW